jgi:aryl-alcohol dehydrogenase-like predicted oxidoreductase
MFEGVLPCRRRRSRTWSPLKSGALSGKYTRATASQMKADRGVFLESFINEKTFAVVDALEAIAHAHGSSVARIALAWVQAQPGVSSIIIGARRLAQLEDNVQAIDVRLPTTGFGIEKGISRTDGPLAC